ncbi:hypothetical protein FNN84_14670 [Salmonella enterica subsp. salamae]|uniref:Uncharacterized protein n=1 Tax=Salmonella enterica subsp. salamae TaxID=59202 RepID=A0A5Y2S2W9_SALER|nr:hypothetical protein [Salmonella enterica subsp. salamae]ECJ2312947.1 hypothetical protein [Salmonella enterica subsp. salamae]
MFDGYVAIKLNPQMRGHAEIVGTFVNDGGEQSVIRSVDFIYHVVSKNKINILDPEVVTYQGDSVSNFIASESTFDFFFFKQKNIKNINMNVYKTKNVYIFQNTDDVAFICVSAP